MADEEDEVNSKPAGRRDMVTIGLLLAAALASIGGFALLFSMWWTTDVTEPESLLRLASREFVDGRPIVAGKLAELAELDSADAPSEPLEMPIDTKDEDVDAQRMLEAAADQVRIKRLNLVRLRDFLIGVGKAAEGKREQTPREQRRFYFAAAPYLELARDHGFPQGRRTQGYQTLGEVYFHLGRFDDAVINLNQAVENEPLLRRQLLPMIAESQFHAQTDQKEDALASVDEYLSDPTLSASVKKSVGILRIKILMGLELWNDLNVALTQHAKQQNDGDQLKHQAVFLRTVANIRKVTAGYNLQTPLEEEHKKKVAGELTSALQVLNALNQRSEKSSEVGLWIGRIKLLQGDVTGAINAFHNVLRKDQTSNAAKIGAAEIIGGLQEIELLTQVIDGEQAVQAIGYLMGEIGSREGFNHDMISFREFSARISQALNQLRQAGEYQAAIDASRSLPPVFDRSEALVQEGKGYRAWADKTLNDGTDFNGQVPDKIASAARKQYRAAGDAFSEAAELRFNSEEYIPTLWSAIDAYQNGNYFSQSIKLLEVYLQQEDRSHQSRGLIAYGKALLAIGEAEQAIGAFEQCIYEYQKDPLRYSARYYGALAYAETGDLDTARRLLRQNVDSEGRLPEDQTPDLKPESAEWQDSLFALGTLLYNLGYRNYLEAEQADPLSRLELLRENQPILESAIRRLEVADQRWWDEHDDPRSKQNAYFTARAHVMAAELPRMQATLPDTLSAAQRASLRDAEVHLQKALVGFRRLGEYLAALDEEQDLSQTDQAMQRNCMMFEADVLKSMKKYQEAAEVYRAVESLYTGKPAAIEAIVGQASCARGLGDDREFEILFRQASEMLKQIPVEADPEFTETTRYDREGWKQLLDWIIQDFDKQKA
ncbi:hypothetical protein OAF83_00360 [Rubripirellula sp.]|nr:hypothetical protein [Rubripirellula sp.]MDB4749333.1 hypothetical protein [Rubripirellula sp.]